MFKTRRRQRVEEVVTEEEVESLKVEVAKLQKQLHQIVDQEIASNNEACGVATNGIVQLNIELEKLREERQKLRDEQELETDALKVLEGQCEEQLNSKRDYQEDAVRLRSATEAAITEHETLQAEIEQCKYIQQQVDNETYYRLIADVQNLETEKERDTILMRHLNSKRHQLQSLLDQLAAERDAFVVLLSKSKKELEDERMTQDMYKSHNISLQDYAERVGAVGKLDNVISSFKGLFSNINRTKIDSEQSATIAMDENRKNETSNEKVRKGSSGKSLSSRSPAALVGGIAYTDRSLPSSDFFRKTPRIFKIGKGGGAVGGGGGSGSDGNLDILNSITNENKEIRINDDSSAQSSITMSDHGGEDTVTASLTEKSEDKL